MADLTRAHQELFRRDPDEQYASLSELLQHCSQERAISKDCWSLPQALSPVAADGSLTVKLGDDGAALLNNWSFSQLCRLSRISKETINRLSPDTASRALRETLPNSDRPIQLLSTGTTVRSLHGVAYTRLWNADLLEVVREFATDFQPPQKAIGGGTGLYCGEQDMFAFLIDPTGWAEIHSEAFAPGFFVWNSEVGRRSLGIQTFWFQAVCQNHIVWDAVELVEFTRKHTASVHDALNDIRRIIENLVSRRDQRRDGFVRVLANAARTRLGDDADSVIRELTTEGIPRQLAREATQIAEKQGALTIFALVDALTRLTQRAKYIADRAQADAQVAVLLALAA